jgi:hypothetical protein
MASQIAFSLYGPHAEKDAIRDGMEAIAEFTTLASLTEAQRPFTHFEPVELSPVR